MTNADCIRHMSDEQLYEFLSEWECGDIDYSVTFCDLCNEATKRGEVGNVLNLDCDGCRKHWLQRDAVDFGGLMYWKKNTTFDTKADRKTEPSNSEIPNNCEPKICDTCRYYNSNIPCGSTPSACKEADKFAEEFVDGMKKLKPTISKMEQVEETRLTAKCLNCANGSSYKCSKCDGEMYYKYDKDEPQTDCAWK